jgi:hypothetical protein
MPEVQGQPYTGPFVADLTVLAPKLIDLPPGGKANLRTEKEGMDDVVTELNVAVPSAAGAAAGVPMDAYKVFVETTEDIAKIRAARAVVNKMAEVLEETEALKVHERENAVGLMVDAVTSSARRKRDRSLLAPFEKTIAYNGQTANKAAKTRKRNAEAKKAAKGQPVKTDKQGNG